jgi:hypothetical protein
MPPLVAHQSTDFTDQSYFARTIRFFVPEKLCFAKEIFYTLENSSK